jgi:hypothetical protein
MERNNIKIEDIVNNVNVYGLESSILASGYPMMTKFDSFKERTEAICRDLTEGKANTNKDIARAFRLGNVPAGSGHNTFLQGIIVQFDLTFSNKVWTEAQRYHFLDFVSSSSTMHKIAKFDLDRAYMPYVDERIVKIMKEKVDEYNSLTAKKDEIPAEEFKEYNKKLSEKYLEILYSNPAGFRLTARMTTNYQQLRTIYRQRKDHRLPEWRVFCSWIEQLPYFKELCLS